MKIDQKASFLYFVYPFLFDPETFYARAAVAAAATLPGKHGAQKVWQVAPFNQDDEVLAHVADYINPQDPSKATAWLWKLSDDLQEVYGLANRAEWQLKHRDRTIPFRLGNVGNKTFAFELALFQDGVGFMIVHAEPVSADPGDWLDFLHHFRFFRGHRQVQITARRGSGYDKQAGQRLYEDFFPEPAGGQGDKLEQVLDSLLRTAVLPGEVRPWWHDIFAPGQLMPFVGLYVDEVPSTEVALLVYRARNFFHLRQDIHPTQPDLAVDQPGLIEYAERQWFLFSLEGGGFLAADAAPTGFFRVTMPGHVRSVYFAIFLLALHERFALMLLAQEMACHWPGGLLCPEPEQEAAFERIRSGLLNFTARGYFAQVMQREHHHRSFQRWEDVFQIPRLYREVRDEARDLYDSLALKRQQRLQELEEARQRRSTRLEQLITAFATVIGAPALGLTLLQTASVTSWPLAIAVGIGALVFGAMILVGARLIIAGRARKG